MPNRDTLPHWLASLPASTLAALLAARPDTVVLPPADLAELAERLSAGPSVHAVVRTLNRMLAEVLAAAQAVGSEWVTPGEIRLRFKNQPSAEAIEDALGQLAQAGLMWPVNGGYELVRPMRSARVGGLLGELHTAPPAPALTPLGADTVDTRAGAAAVPAVRGVTALLELCSATPLDVLRSGGVGVKEVRRAAKALGADELAVRLWLALAYHADLLDADDGVILPTPAADDWLAGSPAARLVPLLLTWWQLPSSPTAPDVHGRPPTALLHAYHDADRALRHDLIGWFAGQPAGSAVTDTSALYEAVGWWRPYVYGEAESAEAIIGEAALLGVLADGGLSSWGRALAGGAESDVLDAVRPWLPAATGSVRLLGDLTAVVAGMPTTELSALLDLAADADERDTASVWRFSPRSVRRALDAGQSADRLLAALTAAADGEVPQALGYLVRDVARRHGELAVAAVGCCVLGDATLLAEVVAHRGLAALASRLLAPGVLASALPVDETLELLRANGYEPVSVDGSGAPVLARVEPRRARPRPHVTPRRPQLPELPYDLVELAEALQAAGVPAPPARGDLVQRFGDHLTSEEIKLLSEALQRETPVAITYLDGQDRGSRRVITPTDVIDGRVEAWCHLRDDERHFLISRIQHVEPSSA
jgi:hypothetical protein